MYTIIATDCPVRTKVICPSVKAHTPLMNSETVERTRKLIGFETMKLCTVVYWKYKTRNTKDKQYKYTRDNTRVINTIYTIYTRSDE